jgi:dolichyl-phosphate-mannose-protein mannosyltransferase
LVHSGSGDAQMSSLFQAQLIGNHFHENPINVAFGSRVTIKNNGYGGGLLHSHVQTFPHGSKQQQVTVYHHKDSNNDWEFKFTREMANEASDDIRLIKDKEVVRIVHSQTGRNLHSHPIAAPVTKTAWEVSGYGNETVGDSNDNWEIEIVDDVHEKDVNNLRSLTTRFRIRHINLNCYLRAHHVTLPQWGFKQGEVVCDKQLRKDVYNLWNIEQHWNDKLPAGSPENYQTHFWHDFIHLNVAMYVSNNALTPDPDKEPDQLTSSPSQWPFLSVGLRMCGWDDHRFKVYLLGNPVLWWSSTISLGLFVSVSFLYLLRRRRGAYDWAEDDFQKFQFLGKYFLLGWFLHYFPFGIMARVTYLHHYFPALYFAILMLALMVDHVSWFLPQKVKVAWFVFCSTVTAGVFLYFAPLSYGFQNPSSEYKNRKWNHNWNLAD